MLPDPEILNGLMMAHILTITESDLLQKIIFVFWNAIFILMYEYSSLNLRHPSSVCCSDFLAYLKLFPCLGIFTFIEISHFDGDPCLVLIRINGVYCGFRFFTVYLVIPDFGAILVHSSIFVNPYKSFKWHYMLLMPNCLRSRVITFWCVNN